MNVPDLVLALAGTSTASALIGALATRSRTRAERDTLRGQAAQSLAEAAGLLADELREELGRLTTELVAARRAAEHAESEAAQLRVELAAARAEIAHLRARIDHLTRVDSETEPSS